MFHPFAIDNCLFWNDCKKYMISHKKAKSQLVINNKYQSQDEANDGLDGKIKKFFFSIADMNNYKGEVDENNYRHNRNFLENSEYNTYFKRESLLKNELDLSEIIKNSH